MNPDPENTYSIHNFLLLLEHRRIPECISVLISLMNHDSNFSSIQAGYSLGAHGALGGQNGRGPWEKEGKVCWASVGMPEQRLAGEMPTHWSGMPRICVSIPLQGLQDAGHHRGYPAKGHQVGHRCSRTGVEVAVDQEGRVLAGRVALPRHKLGPDQPRLGRLGEGVWLLNDPKPPGMLGYITDDVSRGTTRCI